MSLPNLPLAALRILSAIHALPIHTLSPVFWADDMGLTILDFARQMRESIAHGRLLSSVGRAED